jgi:hypothetical protein
MTRRKEPTTAETVLQGWPAISDYLGQPVSTAQRWRKAGMPVEREGRFATAHPEALTAGSLLRHTHQNRFTLSIRASVTW